MAAMVPKTKDLEFIDMQCSVGDTQAPRTLMQDIQLD